MDKIIIKREYFDNIKTAIDSLNAYFSSDLKQRNFPVDNEDSNLDPTIAAVLEWLNNVEPEWIIDSSKLNETIDEIGNNSEGVTGPDVLDKLPESIAEKVYGVIGFRVLEMIANNFQSFNKFIDGIYTFQLFTNPSKYSMEIDLFSQPLQLYELKSLLHDDINISLYDPEKYVFGVFNNDQITLPVDMDQVNETERMKKKTDLKDFEIFVEEATQEAAEINYFENSKIPNIKYDDKNKTWEISTQFKNKVHSLISKLNSCEDTNDLKSLFNSSSHPKPDDFSSVVVPYIIAKIFGNPKKYPFDDYDKEQLGLYTMSYQSIIDKNNGAKRFQNYDLFSTFKSNKQATIKFIEDFLTLNLVNDETCSINDNRLLTIFNIFDSHIYLNIVYNELPVAEKRNVSLDQFIKSTRARINKNSRAVIQDDESKITNNGVKDSDTIKEYCVNELHSFGNMSIGDMNYCEAFRDVVYDEISTLDDAMYNIGMSQIDVSNYIGESYAVMEQITGELPNYIKDRIKTSDDLGTTSEPSTTSVDVPEGVNVPANSIDQLADSVDSRLNTQTDNGLEGMLGSGYQGTVSNGHDGKTGGVVYNITYNNSFNRDSYNSSNRSNTNNSTINDSSTDKTETSTTNMHTTNTNSNNDSSRGKDMSSNKRLNKRTNSSDEHNTTIRDSYNRTKHGDNNYYNSSGFEDTVDDNDDNTLSNGLTVEEMFTILESMEPLSDNTNAMDMPKESSLTKAMDRDMKLLSAQQNGKRVVQKGINTTRAVLKPASRAKQWLTKLVDSLVQRDEDKVKAQIIENPSYRTSLYKGCRLALKLGLIGLSATISGYLAATLAGIGVLKIADKERLKREVQDEFQTEIKILDDKIQKADENGDLKQKYEMMRMRTKMASIAAGTTSRKIISHKSFS